VFDPSRIHKGADVFDSNGNKIGDVGKVGDNHMHVETGGFLGMGNQDLFVPFSDVTSVEDNGNRVSLNVTKDQLESAGGEGRPAQASGVNQQQVYGTAPKAMGEPAYTEGAGRITEVQGNLVGSSLYTSDNHDLGKVYDQGANYAHIKTGLFGLGGDLYVPLDCINNCNDGKCTLNVSSDQLKSMGWDHPPEAGAVSGCRGEAMGQPVSRGEVANAPRYEGQENIPSGTYERANYPTGARETAQGARSMPLREEQLEVHKHREQVGEVDVTKQVEQQEKTIEVPVTHNEVFISERPMDQPTNQPPTGQGEISVPVYEEEVHVEKEPHVYGEVTINERPVTEEQEFHGTVRREVPRIQKKGNVEKDVHVQGNLPNTEQTNEERRHRA